MDDEEIMEIIRSIYKKLSGRDFPKTQMAQLWVIDPTAKSSKSEEFEVEGFSNQYAISKLNGKLDISLDAILKLEGKLKKEV